MIENQIEKIFEKNDPELIVAELQKLAKDKDFAATLKAQLGTEFVKIMCVAEAFGIDIEEAIEEALDEIDACCDESCDECDDEECDDNECD